MQKIGKVLVCDDQTTVRDFTAGYLNFKGWEVFRASCANECLNILQEHSDIEAILMDINLPDKNGDEIAKEIKTFLPNIQIIYMTGDHSAKVSQNEAVLSKPFDIKAINNCLLHLRDQLKTEHTAKHNKILVVDDEDLLRNMLGDFLANKSEFKVYKASNGKEAIEKVKNDNFLAIIMDIRMPELDGIRTLNLMRQSNINTPIILMSGYCEPDDIESVKDKGVYAFVSKPFSPKKMLELVNGIGTLKTANC